VAVLLVGAIILTPSPIDPLLFSLPSPKPFEGVLAPNTKLQESEQLFKGQVVGPESIAVDSSGIIYTGLADGRIVKFVGDKVVDVVRTGTHNDGCGRPELEHVCGRPLGMRFNRYGTKLIVVDAYFGLLEVDTKSSSISTLVPCQPGVDGEPIRFMNDLDIAQDGTIYFTDSSTKWQRMHFSNALLEGDNTGRLLAFHPKTGELEVLMSDLHFANGVQLSPEGDFVLVVELLTARILRYYTRGENEGKMEVFAENLPGHPDNIRPSFGGGYWVGMAAPRRPGLSLLDTLSTRPWLRSLLAKFVTPEMLHVLAPRYGLIVKLSKGGSVQRTLHDPTGQVINGVSEVHEENGVLYLGSYNGLFVGKLKL
ncbi:predicted protein, partial [Nematostella vectensis]